ncbi:unnamed protein product, partial [marine sediment metagenome]
MGQTMKVDLKGSVVIITGAGAGIGKACAKVMLENGAKVIIAEIDKEKGRSAAEDFSTIGTCRFIRTDVTSREDIAILIESVLEEFGRIDVFVNNAGINIGSQRVDIDEFPVEDWNRVLAVDLSGVFNCSQAVSKVMIKQKSGRIVNIGSVLGSVPARKQ